MGDVRRGEWAGGQIEQRPAVHRGLQEGLKGCAVIGEDVRRERGDGMSDARCTGVCNGSAKPYGWGDTSAQTAGATPKLIESTSGQTIYGWLVIGEAQQAYRWKKHIAERDDLTQISAN